MNEKGTIPEQKILIVLWAHTAHLGTYALMHALTRTGQPICAFPCFRYFLHGAEKEDSQKLKAGQLVGCKEEGLR